MKTLDIESITNSTMQAMEKEFRKNGMGGAFHRAFHTNRVFVEGMVKLIVADHMAHEGKHPPKEN